VANEYGMKNGLEEMVDFGENKKKKPLFTSKF
jgi:hypothetical protein